MFECGVGFVEWKVQLRAARGHTTSGVAGPVYVYSTDGQTWDYEGSYLFKVQPIASAEGFLWGFFQNGVMVWENYRDEGTLSGNEYGIHPGTIAHTKFVPGDVEVCVRATINGEWTDATLITIHLQPHATSNEVTIDIKPGGQTNPINTRSSGKIPVVIFSTPNFGALSTVDKTSLTFGRTGGELSLAFCNKGEDVNDDGLLDLVCHFKTKSTGFQVGNTVGFLKEQNLEGVSIEGSDLVRILK
jgi:hypothetical protein